MKTRDYKLNLWKEFMEHTEYVLQRDRETMGRIAGTYVDDVSFLMRIYEAYVEKERFIEDEEHSVRYERDGEDYILALERRECVFSKENFRKVIVSMLDLLEDTLPLGSVVDLKKSAYKNVPEASGVEHIRMVITYRFLGKEEDSHYFPYAGVVYPTGMLGRKEVLYFTRPLVEKVVREGYRDEQEDAYVYLMKKELVIEKGKNSFGYATKEEIEAFNAQVKRRDA